MTLNESKAALRNICKQNGIALEKNIYALVNEPIQMWRFLVALAFQGFPFGFDMFDGTCSGNAKIRIDGDFISLVALDCGSSEFLFAPKSLIIIIPDADKTPTIVFESSNYIPTNANLSENIRESLDMYNYEYVEALRLASKFNSNLIFGKDEVDTIINDWNSGIEDANHYYRLQYFLSRKVFAFVNVQLNSVDAIDARIPLLLKSNYLINNQDKAIKTIDAELRSILRI